jgi:uncharacterized protein (TIGR03086 family)
MFAMSLTTDPRVLLSHALDQTGGVLAGIHEDQASLSTPCASWTVGLLINHVISDLRQFAVRAEGGTPDFGSAAPEVDPADWADAFTRGAAALLDAWRKAGDLSGTIKLPMGELPASFPVNQQVAEFAVHSWDLVRATGQNISLDAEIATAALNWARSALQPEFRGDEASGKAFGPEVALSEDAPVYDRLAAFFGRHP